MSSSSTDPVAPSSTTDPASPGPDLLEVGRIEKPHGVRGDVIVRLTTNRVERLAPGTVLRTPTGTIEVLASKPHHDRFLVTIASAAQSSLFSSVNTMRSLGRIDLRAMRGEPG